MPPSLANQRERVPRVPSHKRSVREQQRPPPPGSPIPVESSPSSPEAQTQQASSPPQPQEEPQLEELQPEEPQLEEISADVHEQTIDPASLIIASVVSSI